MNPTVFAILIIFFLSACNNAGDGPNQPQTKTEADSLMEIVMKGHDVAMGKMSRVSSTRKKVQQQIDSLNALTGKARSEAAGYKIPLDTALARLTYAENAMNKWMDEFNMDSAKNNPGEQSKYLQSEIEKIEKVNDSMKASLQAADSILKNGK